MSDFFNEYVKIAEKMGLIDKDDYITAEEEIKQQKLAKERDMEEATAILYGVKPNGKEDDVSLIEKAHPDVRVVFPAEDRLNGIVENDQQRQDVLVEIANRPSNGKYQQRLFISAYDDLLLSLVKAGNTLDLNDKPELAMFADNCATKLVKESIAPLAIFGYAAVVSAIGGIAAINYTGNVAQNVVANCTQAIEELEDLRGTLGHGIVNDIVRDLYDLKLYANKFSSLPKIKAITPDELLNIQDKYKDELKVAAAYRSVLVQASKNIPVYISELQSAESSDEGSSDWWEKVKYVARIFTPSEIQDAVNALEGLNKAVMNAINSVDHYAKSAEQYTPTIKEVFEKSMGPVSNLVEPDKEDIPGSIADLLRD